ncbi:hypothetical protein [Nocardioides sp. R-C-SC26]|uniref:hypothetical protein n=1 Tax=Nocardioides sp. R-C-SC26 TaxID=2870414 RepID=UPI001E4A091F|nr:hypothetical protein [Nocardioides sp. R-C-SC26]
MPATSRPPRAFRTAHLARTAPVVAAAFGLATLAACGDGADEEARERAEATASACRVVQLTGASLDSSQAELSGSRSGPGVVQDYAAAIATATDKIGDADVDASLLDAATALIGAWSRTRTAAQRLIEDGAGSSGPSSSEVAALISAERRLLDDFATACDEASAASSTT